MGAIIAILTLALIGNAMASPADKAASKAWVKKYLEPWAWGIILAFGFFWAACENGWIGVKSHHVAK